MKTPHEPLTPEERALAQSLSRLGPHGGPSPGLDARILGAARAAVQDAPGSRGATVPPARRRWPLGMGVAASVLLAAGIAWQLRPTQQVPVASEVPVLAKRETAVMSAPAEQAADAAAAAEMDAAAAPPPVDAYEPPPPVRQIAPPVIEAAPAPPASPARRNAEAAARQEAAPKRGPLSMIPAVPGLPAPAEPALTRKAAAPQAFPEVAENRASAAAADAEERALQQQTRQRVLAEQQREQQLRSESERRASEAKAAADTSDTLDSVMVTGSRISRQDGFSAAPAAAPPPPPPAPAPAASTGASAPSVARNTLRRTELQVPVDEDTRLAPAEWLDRIRLRRDLGDSANALRSLQLFVQEHPFQRVPDDLRPLLGTP